MRRLRPADWLLLVSAVAVPVTLSLTWFTPTRTGWSALGWWLVALIVITAGLGLLVVILIAAGARDAVNVPPASCSWRWRRSRSSRPSSSRS